MYVTFTFIVHIWHQNFNIYVERLIPNVTCYFQSEPLHEKQPILQFKITFIQRKKRYIFLNTFSIHKHICGLIAFTELADI